MVAAVEGAIRACPQCGSEAFRALSGYSSPPWQIVECPSCTFVYLRNPPEYKHLVSDFAWEKTRVAEVERRKARSPIRMWLDSMTRWRAGFYSPGIAGTLKRLFTPGRVLDVGCGFGKKVPEPFIPFGVEISEALSREADDHMRARGGRAVHAPARSNRRSWSSNARACWRQAAPSMCACLTTEACVHCAKRIPESSTYVSPRR